MEYIYGFMSCSERADKFRDKFYKMEHANVVNREQSQSHQHFRVRSIHWMDRNGDKVWYVETNKELLEEWKKRYNCRGSRDGIDIVIDDRDIVWRKTIELVDNPYNPPRNTGDFGCF